MQYQKAHNTCTWTFSAFFGYLRFLHAYTLYIHAWWNLLFYLFKCTIINFGLFFIYRCRDWSYFKKMVLISVYLNIQYNWHGYALIKKFWGGGWGEGCLRDTFFARKRRGGAFLYISWEFEKYDNSAGSDSPAAPPPHPTITCSNFSYTDIRVYLCTLCQNSYNDIPFGLQGPCLEPKTSCWLYL